MRLKLKIKKLIVPFLKRKLLKKRFSAIVNITGKCNLHCRHCYYQDKARNEIALSQVEWEKRFQNYYKNGIRLLMLVGGEPTLRLDLVKLAEKIFPYVFLYTNGLIKIPSDLDLRIMLSLDGLGLEHNKIRGAGVFEKASRNYQNDKRVTVNCVLSKLNYTGPERLNEFIDYVEQMGVGGLHIDFYVPRRGSQKDKKLILDQEQFEEIGQVLNERLKKKNNLKLLNNDIVDCQIRDKFDKAKCLMKEDFIIYGSDNKEKYCVCDELDCRLCRARCRYSPSLRNPIKLLKFKALMWRWSL